MVRLPRFDDAGAAPDPTIAATLDAWLEVAEGYFTGMEVSRIEAETFVANRCSAAPELDDAGPCSTLD